MKTLFKITMTICMAMLAMSVDCTEFKDPDEDGPDGPGEQTGNPWNLTKKTLESIEDLRAFIPPGIYHVEGGIMSNYILGRGNDGSFVFTLKDATHPVEVFFDDRYFYAQWSSLPRPGWNKTEVHHQPKEELYRGNFLMLTMGYLPPNLLAFISSDLCEKKPTSVKDEMMAGVKVKHYVYEEKSMLGSSFQEFWVMETGLCLKRKIYSVVAGITIPQPLSDFTVTVTDINPGDFKSIWSKLPSINVGGNQPQALPAYDNIHRYQFKEFNDKWRTDLYPRVLDKWIKPYTGSGTIESTTIYRHLYYFGGSDNLILKTFDIDEMHVWIPGASHQDILDYIKNEVMTIELMEGITTIDSIEETGMYGWEGNNDKVAANPGIGQTLFYISYKIICWGNALYQISIQVCSVTGV